MKAPSFDVATVIIEKYNFSLSELNQANYSEGYKEENFFPMKLLQRVLKKALRCSLTTL